MTLIWPLPKLEKLGLRKLSDLPKVITQLNIKGVETGLQVSRPQIQELSFHLEWKQGVEENGEDQE